MRNSHSLTKAIPGLLVAAALLFFSSNLSAQNSDQFSPFFFPGITTCDGDVVDISGKFHSVFKVNFDAAGGLHVVSHINAIGEGIGLNGDRYLWRDNINETVNASVGFNNSFTQSLKLIGKGKAANTIINVNIQFVVNANGDVVVDNFDVSESCN